MSEQLSLFQVLSEVKRANPGKVELTEFPLRLSQALRNKYALSVL